MENCCIGICSGVSPTHGMDDKTYASNIFVVDNTYKFNSKMALRAELQYLYSTDYEKDWMAALLEFSMAHAGVSV